MPTQPETQPENEDGLIDIPFNMADIDQYAIESIQTNPQDLVQTTQESALLGTGDYRKKNLEQQLKEQEQTHEIRKKHLGRLFFLTLSWVVVIWLVVILQGFGKVPKLSAIHDLAFKLSDAVLIAFMTTTTTTVLGLYGIAAYWLYGGKKTPSEVDEKEE